MIRAELLFLRGAREGDEALLLEAERVLAGTRSDEGLTALAEARWRRAVRMPAGEPARALVRAGLAAADAALSRNVRSARALLVKARLLELEATAAGAPASEGLRGAARALMGHATSLSPHVRLAP